MRIHFEYILIITLLILSACQSNNPGMIAKVNENTPISTIRPHTPPVLPSLTPSLAPTFTSTPNPSPTFTVTPSPTPTNTPDLPWYLAGKPLTMDNLYQLAVLEEWQIDDPDIDFIRHLAISPDNKILAVQGYLYNAFSPGNKVKFFNIATKEIIYDFNEGSQRVSDMKFSPDGSLFAIGSWGYYVKIWRTTDWKVIKQLEPNGEVNSIAFSPDGKYMVVGSNNGAYYANSYQCSISVWDTRNWKMVIKETFSKTSCVIENLVFSTDGTKFAFSMMRNLAQIRNLEDLELIAELTQAEDSISTAINFSADGKGLFVHIGEIESRKSKVLLWDYLNGSVKGELSPIDSYAVNTIQLLADPSVLMVVNQFSKPYSPIISFWNLMDDTKILDFLPTRGLDEEDLLIRSSFLSYDKGLLVLGLESEAVGDELSGTVAIKKIVFYGSR